MNEAAATSDGPISLSRASCASLTLTISKASADAIAANMNKNGWYAPPIVVNPLGIEPWLLDRARLDPPQPDIPYFVRLNVLESRKNRSVHARG